MEALLAEHQKLANKGNLSKSVDDVQKTIDLLVNARDAVAASKPAALLSASFSPILGEKALADMKMADPSSTSVTLAKLQNPVKQSFESINSDLKEVYKGLGNYSKALDKKFKDKPLPTPEYDALASHQTMINRAIAMHLLREGQFSVASTFIADALRDPHADLESSNRHAALGHNFGYEPLKSDALREQFASMYHILHQMKAERNLFPAIHWARANSAALEARGSNLEFELEKTQFIWLFLGRDNPPEDPRAAYQGQQKALHYARTELSSFQARYMREIKQLIGAIAFCANLQQSPYRRTFCNNDVWDDLANSFTREFCSLLGLSADSPLYIAATAGAIALPTLQKLQTIMKEKRTEWTTQNELPVEIPLPPAYRFHSIFVCPISKEQTTDENPPMMMPCGHVIAQESLSRHAKGGRFKCPYCPSESHPREAKTIFI